MTSIPIIFKTTENVFPYPGVEIGKKYNVHGDKDDFEDLQQKRTVAGGSGKKVMKPLSRV